MVGVALLAGTMGCDPYPADVLRHEPRGNLTDEGLAQCEPLPPEVELIESDGGGAFAAKQLVTGWWVEGGADPHVLRLTSDPDLQCEDSLISPSSCIDGWGLGLWLREGALVEATMSLPVAATELEFAQAPALEASCVAGGGEPPEAGAIEFFAINDACVTGRLTNAGPLRLSGGFYALRCVP